MHVHVITGGASFKVRLSGVMGRPRHTLSPPSLPVLLLRQKYFPLHLPSPPVLVGSVSNLLSCGHPCISYLTSQGLGSHESPHLGADHHLILRPSLKGKDQFFRVPSQGREAVSASLGDKRRGSALVRESLTDLICVYFYFFPPSLPPPESVLDLDCPFLSSGPRAACSGSEPPAHTLAPALSLQREVLLRGPCPLLRQTPLLFQVVEGTPSA